MYCTSISLFVVLAYASLWGVYGSESLTKLESSAKIVGGSDTTIQKHPYQVYLLLTRAGTGYKYQCSGSIVKSRCVITAAQCLTGKMSVEIRAGSANASSGGTTYNSRTFMSHPRFNSTTKDFDIGIIRLTIPIKLDGKNTSAINFPSSNCSVESGENVTVSGWGATEQNGDYSPTLMEASLDTVDFSDCKKEYKLLTPRMVCAEDPYNEMGACYGDAGSPLVRTGTKNQIGIASFGKSCTNLPGVYTNLCNVDIQNWLKKMDCA